jgi:hypothetical protein
LIEPWKERNKRFIEGILESIEREIVDVEKLEDGQYFGELISESVYGNPYRIKGHLWLPLSYLRKHSRFKFLDDLVLELKGKSDEEIYKKSTQLLRR